MRTLRRLCLLTLAGCLFMIAPPRSYSQVTIQIGPAPMCPYGYFGYPPYGCAPYGYYGPTWFSGGVFIGAGPWFHGPAYFHGYVNRYYDPRFGYHGYLPHRGERADWEHHREFEHEFHGTEWRDPHDHVYHGNGNAYGHYKDHDDHGHYKDHDDHGHDHDHGN